MTVYWDLLALWNFAIDYLLLRGTVYIAGRSVRRGRLLLSAALGAAYSVAVLALALPMWTVLLMMCVMCCFAFARTGRRVKLTLLFAVLACTLGGGVILLGHVCGGMERLACGLVYARLPWGIFFAATGISYLLFTFVFRGSARHDGEQFVRARIKFAGRTVDVRLFCDTGNILSDPMTGEGVPVIDENALSPLFSKENRTAHIAFTTLHARTIAGGNTALQAFRCDELNVDGRNLGARLIALSPEAFGDAYQGLWFDDKREETERHELEKNVG